MSQKLIIAGDSAFAEIAYEYFTHDSDYQVVGFTVERDYLRKLELFGLPVVPFEELEDHFVPAEHAFFAAATYTQLNRLRSRLYLEAKARGYAPASYISSRAFVWHNVKLGEHCFIFEDNTLQPFVSLGDNVVLWSGNHIGHHSRIEDNCFIASHAVVSGFCEIGANCFLGVNVTLVNNIRIGADCLIGAGALVAKDVEEDSLVKTTPGSAGPSARRYFKVKA
ncbi:acetyltransferase [Pseudomonas nicosulfuronedens]